MPSLILLRLAAFSLLLGFAFAQTLPADEVESLKVIAKTLGKTNWNFSVDPCSGLSGWFDPLDHKIGYENTVTCNCTFVNNTVCHIVKIRLKAQSLTGTVPSELIRLPFLQDIDLARNYLNGSIPPEWGSMNLVNISLIGNRVTGPLPVELANISTLASLALEYNQLSGTIPPEYGNLTRLERFFLNSNNLSGELPQSLATLTALQDFRIGDNNFTGSIPTFIQNWTNLDKLVIQGSGLTGPIPSGIAALTKLTDLRISDLNGNEETPFPPLGEMKLKTLILRSCNIVGELPVYLGNMTTLKILDLSFNHLSGPIPASFFGLVDTDYIYLTGNSLTGEIPAWMLTDGQSIDLSYNSFTTSTTNCQPRTLNLFASSKGNTTGVVSCLQTSQCVPKYSLRINCGGVANGDYQDDRNSGGPSNFIRSNDNWGFSSTGHFLDDASPVDSYIVSSNSSITGQNPELYSNARLSPLSLTYYAFCMGNGNYNVSLHFAEIMFTNDTTYSSLGRRLFDVYIQGSLVLKDFNIAAEAGGVQKPLVKTFTAAVTDGALDIRFYYAGKGTNGIPVRGVYGPLISAISVDPNFEVPNQGKQ